MSADTRPADATPFDIRDGEWTWLYDDYDAGTVFITDDPTGEQRAIADGLPLERAEKIVSQHNAIVRDLTSVVAELTIPACPAPEVVKALRQVLVNNCVDAVENQGLHSWRCQYPESYGKGPCDCFENLVAELVAALPAQREPTTPELDVGTIERACIAVVGQWFDESSERGKFSPLDLARRIAAHVEAEREEQA